MNFKMIHENYNVYDLQKSLDFYEKALGLKEKRRKEAADGSFIIVYVANDRSDFELELTGRIILGIANFIWHFGQMTTRLLMRFIKKWDVSVMRIRKWGFTLYKTQMDTGWKFFHRSCRLFDGIHWNLFRGHETENALEWTGRLINIRTCAREIANRESFTHRQQAAEGKSSAVFLI